VKFAALNYKNLIFIQGVDVGEGDSVGEGISGN